MFLSHDIAKELDDSSNNLQAGDLMLNQSYDLSDSDFIYSKFQYINVTNSI